jgi:hypothetical protein
MFGEGLKMKKPERIKPRNIPRKITTEKRSI